ncbi:monofunctional biosynthetic peptidoglycan transglycosylase [Solilutibacter silvestris]|uniref:Biosynthetic peptidoglycan transglycosylase n=1 Tax=Solilutibacter silvestris TaxID=1645665 RepID=A0A2K1PXA7_9GAMM|nr:monofunctional biosynthetic peptidoglycan transglycosylase [Lysobacter silvestris]PNS07424.1 monofunctional biosynthetic peptidoglycan transglycosylase [Lysobacter silvestris]
MGRSSVNSNGDASLDAQGTRRGSRRKRLRKWLLWLPAIALGFSILQVASLRVINPPFSSFMAIRLLGAWLSGDGGFRVAYDWRPLAKISPSLPVAVMASEDQKFAEHDGFDFDAIQAAERYNARMKARAEARGRPVTKVRGASTISQQTAKNLFLWQGDGVLRWARKGLEVWYTFLMEHLLPKERILELYVNIAEFGDGVYGAQAASRSFFGVDASRMSSAQAARLAAVLPSPRRFSAAHPSTYVLRRANAIQRQMGNLGGVDALQDVEDAGR